MKIRKIKWPLWYYGMIGLTVISAGAGTYFRGTIVQGDIETARVTMGLILTALCGLAAWAFRSLVREVRSIRPYMGTLADAVVVLLLRESRSHPEDTELELLLRNMIREREQKRYGAYGDD